MSSNADLTCNFTITTSLDVGISFESDDGGTNYGGLITIWTPGTAGPVTTGLWDSDGDVYFTIYNHASPGQSCTINSASYPGSWNPYVTVSEAGLSCAITGPVPAGDGTYNYTLAVTLPAAGAARAQAAADAPPPRPRRNARMLLPAGGMEAWTLIMQGSVPVPDEVNTGSPIVTAWTRFDDGTQVAGGVYKGTTPTETNVKFMWVFDASGNQYPGWPIDVSDDEDFLTKSYIFSLTPGGETYQLNIVEKQSQERL